MLVYARARVRASTNKHDDERARLVRELCKSIRAPVRAPASARADAYTCARVRACARRYPLLRLHLEPALLRRDGRDRAVGRRWLRRALALSLSLVLSRSVSLYLSVSLSRVWVRDA